MPALACPACGATYRVPEAALGRQLKCARCAHQWRAEAGQVISPFGRAVEALAAAPPLAAPPVAAAPPPAPSRPPAPPPDEDDILARHFDPGEARAAAFTRVSEGDVDGLPAAPVTGPLRGGAPMAASSVATRPPSRGGVALAFAWAGSLAALAGGLYALAAFRAQIAEAWPPFQRVAGWFGG